MKHDPKRGLRSAVAAVLFSLAVAAAALFAPGEAISRTDPATIPVLVIWDDGDPDSVKRTANHSRAFMSELKGELKRRWFQPIDEVEAAARLGLDVRDRLTNNQLFELLRNIRVSGKLPHVMAVVLLRLRIAMQRTGAGATLSVEFGGEVRDFISLEWVDDFRVRRRQPYPVPSECGAPCISKLVRGAAPDFAAVAAEILARKLRPYRDGSVNRGYTVILRDFDRVEMRAIIDVMAREFPGYRSHRLVSSAPGTRSYSYQSSAAPGKLEEWLSILLGDMGFALDKGVRILIDGPEVTVVKIAPPGG
ncbi:MAG: hypothetical protein OXQ29_03010 [Rhodospirillaceae bacterium]|nr:hypothetical protein [Rhodospirillaceae bacterium]